MNGTQCGKTCNLDKPFPGCLGSMVNLFDLSTGVAGNRLLTDKPHCDEKPTQRLKNTRGSQTKSYGSPLSRSRSDVARMSPLRDKIEDKVLVSEAELRTSYRTPNGTPMKMHIAREMSKEMESKHNPPSVVAKLMGLDALPLQQHNSAAKRSHSRGYARSHSDTPLGHWQQEHGFFDTQIQRDRQDCQDRIEYKDVYEIWKQSQNAYVRDRSPQRRMHNEDTNEKKMALVRQKFIEAKRLSTDEKLRQSKQFQDALEVLNSNKDLFLKFLQEPNSLFSQHLYDSQSIPPPPETKRITVLRPSKMVDANKISGLGKKNEKQVMESFSPPANWRVDDSPTQPTRIVVLKPSPGKAHDIKPVVSPPSSSPVLHGERFRACPDDNETRESREVAKEITRQMRENLGGHRRDETSSVFSNGHLGDESSFNKSEHGYEAEILSDSEVMSPTSRHSWDYIHRFGSPYSSSSFSRASYSPESSVCREAKKRLSERWAMMASNGICQEQRHVRRSSSTLGEMLALSDAKKPDSSKEEIINKELEPRESTSYLPNDVNKDENVDNSPRNLLRSKSLPVTSTVNGARLNVEVSNPEVVRIDVAKEVTKTRTVKSSLKGKVSSLFFSRNKKSSKERSRSEDGSQIAGGILVGSPGKVSDGTQQCVNKCELDKVSSTDLAGMGQKQGSEAGLSLMKPVAPVNLSESQDQPSPISVLEPPFEEDDNTTLKTTGNMMLAQLGAKLPTNPIKSNLIDKSPPIESIARTLSWDDSSVGTATPYPVKPYFVSQESKEVEREWLICIRTLLSDSGLDGKVQSGSFLARWHSLESPLDPSLRDKYVDSNDKGKIHEAKRRQRRSTRKLIFDCVNAALVDISGYGSDTSLRAIVYGGGVHSDLIEGASPIMEDRVWTHMKEWFSGDVKCVSIDGGDSHSMLVERVVKKEVVGRGWVEQMRLETDNLGKEIEGKLLEELLQEAVVELTGRV